MLNLAVLALAVLTAQAPAMSEEDKAVWRMVANNLAHAPEWYDPAITAAAHAAAQGTDTSTIVWAPHGGTIPPGLTLAPSGLLEGTPSQAGTFEFTIVATVPIVGTILRNVTITIAPAVVIDPAPPPSGMVGAVYQHQFQTQTQQALP